jgi:hypothetical protein
VFAGVNVPIQGSKTGLSAGLSPADAVLTLCSWLQIGCIFRRALPHSASGRSLGIKNLETVVGIRNQ